MKRAEAFLFASQSARRLAAVRIGLCTLLVVRLLIDDFDAVAGQPAALFQPLSFMKLLSAMPSHEVAVTLQVIGIVAGIAAAAGLWIRASLPLAFVCLVVINGMLNSTGKVVHNDVLLTLCLIPCLAAGRASVAVWSLEAMRRRRRGVPAPPANGPAYGWPIRTAMVAIGLAYLFVGIQKLRYSGLDWVTSENMRWILYASSDAHPSPNAVALFIADHSWLAHLSAAALMATELGFVLCLFFARLRWLFVPAAIGLHLGTGLLLGLDYTAWAATVAIVFVDWPVVVDWRSRRLGRVGPQPLGG